MSELPPILNEPEEDKPPVLQPAKPDSMFNLNVAVSLKNPVVWVIIVITGVFAVGFVLEYEKELGPFFADKAADKLTSAQQADDFPPQPTPANPNEPPIELVNRAQTGDVEAQLELGKFYANKNIWRQEYKAKTWLQKAAAQNHVEAIVELGKLEPDGQAQRFRQAADLGHAEAQHRLAVLLAAGEPTDTSQSEAVELWGKAARGGNADAQYILGTLHRYGKLVNQNPVTAHAWLKLAVENNHPVAAQSLKALETELTPEQVAQSSEIASEILKAPRR